MSAEYRKDAPQHGEPKHQDSPLHAQKGYETLDAQAGATYRAGVYILGTMFLAAAAAGPDVLAACAARVALAVPGGDGDSRAAGSRRVFPKARHLRAARAGRRSASRRTSS